LIEILLFQKLFIAGKAERREENPAIEFQYLPSYRLTGRYSSTDFPEGLVSIL
jgi:hypothetical protein